MISETRGLAMLVTVFVLCRSCGEGRVGTSLVFEFKVLSRGDVVVVVGSVLVVVKLGWWFLCVSKGLE